MNLGRVLGITAVIVCLIVVLNGLAMFFLSGMNMAQHNRQSLEILSQTTASNLQATIREYTEITENIAKSPRVGMLLEVGDKAQLDAEQESLTALVSGILQVRLLHENVTEPDQTKSPHMGFADLEMVRAALDQPPKPMVHAYRTPNSHLAIARKVVVDGRGRGVVLVSIATDFLTKALNHANVSGALRIAQGSLDLATNGDKTLTIQQGFGSVPVGGTDIQVRFWEPGFIGAGWLALLAAVLLSVALTVLAFVYSSRWLKRLVSGDQAVILRLIGAQFAGRKQGNYPVKLKEFELLVSKIMHLKSKGPRIDEKIAKPPKTIEDDSDLELDGASYLAPERGIEVQSNSSSIAPSSIFRAYDIRGVVDETLTEEGVTAIGSALGSEAQDCGQQNVIIAHDGRASSPRLSAALTKGLQESGCNVIDIGMVPTPVLYFATNFLDSSSGVMVTGSHNPPEYNGLKMVIDGETLSGDRIKRLEERIQKSDYLTGSGTLESRDLIPDYVGTVIDDVQLGSPLKVVMDCGNGVAGKLAPVLLRTLGCEVVELYCDVDGNFPNHHPDPSKPENLRDLIEKVKQEDANLGIAFDGDGDRLGVVDSAGNIIWPDRQMMVYAADVLSRQPGADIIFDVKCSRNLSKEIVKYGGRPLMWKTGHSLIKAKIKETNAALAGEMSGHIFFGERWFGFDDGLYSAARLIEILSADPRPSSEIFAEYPDSVNTPEINIPMEEGENLPFVEQLLSSTQFPDAKITDIDGLRADFLNGWGLVRASNTTPSLVLRFEAESDESLVKIQQKFKDAMLKINPDLVIPF